MLYKTLFILKVKILSSMKYAVSFDTHASVENSLHKRMYILIRVGLEI